MTSSSESGSQPNSPRAWTPLVASAELLDDERRTLFGRHRQDSNTPVISNSRSNVSSGNSASSESRSRAMESLLSPNPSPPPSPGTVHRQKTISSPLALRKRSSVAFTFGEKAVQELTEALQASGHLLFLDQCQDAARFTYAVVTQSHKQVGWARAEGEDGMLFFDRSEQCIWRGSFVSEFQNRSLSDDDMSVRRYDWLMETDLPLKTAHGQTKSSASLLVRVALKMSVRSKPLPSRPSKPLPVRPVSLVMVATSNNVNTSEGEAGGLARLSRSSIMMRKGSVGGEYEESSDDVCN